MILEGSEGSTENRLPHARGNLENRPTLETALRLHRHEPGTLTRSARYLHRRTGGMIGSLSHLVRAAAQMAILEGDEAITRKLLDTIPVDHAAESGQHGAA